MKGASADRARRSRIATAGVRMGAVVFRLWWVWPFFCGAFGYSEEIRVATYNVRNYLTMDRRVEDRWRPEYPKPESEKRVVRETIRRIDPDILLLQEIGGPEHLAELRRDLANEGLDYAGMHVLEAADEDRRLAALWKAELDVAPVDHVDLTIRYFGERLPVKRGLMELNVERSRGSQWMIFNMHLKSKYTDDDRDQQSTKRRSEEAEAIRDRILEVVDGSGRDLYLVVGDLNDTPNHRPIRALLRRGEREISRQLRAADTRGETWTHYYRKGETYSLVDYILRSPGFASLEGRNAQIHDARNFYEGSDHRLVWIDVPVQKESSR